MKSIVLGPGESRAIDGHQARIKASSEDCEERFCVLESVVGIGDGPGLHVHRRHLESFYVLEGELEVRSAHDSQPAPAGSFVLSPAGSPHTFTNPHPVEARFFGFCAPGGLDRFFTGLGEILGDGGRPDLGELGDLMRRFDSAPAHPETTEGPPTTVLGPGEGETFTILGNTISIKADAEATGGAFGLFEYTAAPGFPGPPPHFHREDVEVFFVLEGGLLLMLGDDIVEARPGSFVLVAPGTVHRFSNPGKRPCRFLGIVSPGGFERYFREVNEAFGDGPPDPMVMRELMSSYDIVSV